MRKTIDEPVLFAASVVGAMPRPAYLRDMLMADPPVPVADYERSMDAAVRHVVAMQERAGLDVITDGEYRRTTYISHFVESCDGLDFRPSSFRFYDPAG